MPNNNRYKRDSKGRFVKGNVPLLKGGKMPEWWREKDSLGKNLYYEKNPEARKKISADKIRYFKNPKNRDKARRIRLEFLRKHPEFKGVLRQAALKKYKEHPEIARMNAASGREYWNNDSRRKQRSIEMKEFWTPIKRKEQRELKKRFYAANPEVRKEIDRIVTSWWKDHPLERKKRAEKIKQFFIKNPSAFNEFMKHGKNPLKRHLKTKQGFLVRSNGERQIANCLHAHNTVSLYEAIDLMIKTKPFKGNICNPDFYLPSFNIFIEFYGGYPSAWKKKVLKNKIYTKHKIPVLGITPAELKDLDYFLLKQGEKLSKTAIARNFKIGKWID